MSEPVGPGEGAVSINDAFADEGWIVLLMSALHGRLLIPTRRKGSTNNINQR